MQFLMAHSSANNWDTEIASMSHVTFKHVKGTKNILTDNISKLRCIGIHDALDQEEVGKEFGYVLFEELPPFKVEWNEKKD